MGLNKPRPAKPATPPKLQALPADVKAALINAVKVAKSQVAVARDLGVSGAVVSFLLADKYPGAVDQMAERIRGRYMGATVACPVYIRKKPKSPTKPQPTRVPIRWSPICT